jgi:small subunit ribosomal protein S6
VSSYYEMMYILRPDLSEEQVNESVNKYNNLLSEQGAGNISVTNRGKKRLAYPVKKFLDGIYIQLNYEADGKQVAPLERAMRISEDVIRYITFKVKSPATEEAVTATVNASQDSEG